MPSQQFTSFGNRHLTAAILYILVLAYPILSGFVIAGHKVPWPNHAGCMFLTIIALGCLVGRKLMPEFNEFVKAWRHLPVEREDPEDRG